MREADVGWKRQYKCRSKRPCIRSGCAEHKCMEKLCGGHIEEGAENECGIAHYAGGGAPHPFCIM